MDRYNVTGMSCAACAARVEKAVSSVEGVSSCAVNLFTNSMGVEGTASADEIIAAVEKAGYGASALNNGAADDNKMLSSLEDTETPKIKKRLMARKLMDRASSKGAELCGRDVPAGQTLKKIFCHEDHCLNL